MNRTRNRQAAALLACGILLQTAAAMPVYAADSYIFSDSFDSGDCGWESRGGATVKATSDNPYAGTGALSVTGRSDSWNGAQKSLESVCTPGETYSFSVCARYESGPQSVNFMLSLSYKDESGTVVESLAEMNIWGAKGVSKPADFIEDIDDVVAVMNWVKDER